MIAASLGGRYYSQEVPEGEEELRTGGSRMVALGEHRISSRFRLELVTTGGHWGEVGYSMGVSG